MAFDTSRTIAATPEQVFAAFSDVARLSRWWGPAGFTNTFREFGLEAGARWRFTMHAPDGKNYPNETEVTDVVAPSRVVLHHVSPPEYVLTVTLEPVLEGTRVRWHQAFTKAEIEPKLAPIVRPANEQNLDRLTAEVLATR